MKKSFKFYIIIWAILLAIYNLAVFLVKPIIPGYVFNYDARFWISWGVIIATYIGQLFCAKTAFDSKNNEKFFLNIPLITESYTALIIATIVGSVLMLIPDCPAWIAAIVCAAVFGISVISVIKAKVAADLVSGIDDKIKVQTSFIKTFTVDAESLMKRAQSEIAKTSAKKVYEAVRYSDPMSSNGLSGIESEISIKFNQFASAITSDSDDINTIADELIILISDRNNRCKLMK